MLIFQAQIFREVYKPTTELVMTRLEALLHPSSGFFGPRLSYADFVVANYVLHHSKEYPEVFAPFGKLLQHAQRVHQLPQLQDYLKRRGY